MANAHLRSPYVEIEREQEPIEQEQDSPPPLHRSLVAALCPLAGFSADAPSTEVCFAPVDVVPEVNLPLQSARDDLPTDGTRFFDHRLPASSRAVRACRRSFPAPMNAPAWWARYTVRPSRWAMA